MYKYIHVIFCMYTFSSLTCVTCLCVQYIIMCVQNAKRLPKGQRHSEILRKFATSLLIYSGLLAYDFLQKNVSVALPCLCAVKRILYKEYKTINEGHFRFDELSDYLEQHNAPKVVTVGEDATRIIARIDYDNQTNRCVGFVLPIDDKGLPIVDSFLAVSFQRMEEMFKTSEISKYAYILYYMVQALCNGVPPFCLSCICMGTNNKFTAMEVLKRWQYIITECEKRNIYIVSFGGDGDSRIMKAMRMSVGLWPHSKMIAPTVACV